MNPKQEPVAVVTGVYGGRFTYAPIKASVVLPVGTALYTRPQPRKPLTDREIGSVIDDVKEKSLYASHHFGFWIEFCRAIESAHGIKGVRHE